MSHGRRFLERFYREPDRVRERAGAFLAGDARVQLALDPGQFYAALGLYPEAFPETHEQRRRATEAAG